jgi:hypothetical protein
VGRPPRCKPTDWSSTGQKLSYTVRGRDQRVPGLPLILRTLPIGVKMYSEVSDGEDEEAVQRGVQT